MCEPTDFKAIGMPSAFLQASVSLSKARCVGTMRDLPRWATRLNTLHKFGYCLLVLPSRTLQRSVAPERPRKLASLELRPLHEGDVARGRKGAVAGFFGTKTNRKSKRKVEYHDHPVDGFLLRWVLLGLVRNRLSRGAAAIIRGKRRC